MEISRYLTKFDSFWYKKHYLGLEVNKSHILIAGKPMMILLLKLKVRLKNIIFQKNYFIDFFMTPLDILVFFQSTANDWPDDDVLVLADLVLELAGLADPTLLVIPPLASWAAGQSGSYLQITPWFRLHFILRQFLITKSIKNKNFLVAECFGGREMSNDDTLMPEHGVGVS